MQRPDDDPMHASAMAARDDDMRFQKKRDAAIAQITLTYNVTHKDATAIYYYHYDMESVNRNDSYGLFTEDHHMPRKPQVLVNWEQAQHIASMPHNFGPGKGFHPQCK